MAVPTDASTSDANVKQPRCRIGGRMGDVPVWSCADDGEHRASGALDYFSETKAWDAHLQPLRGQLTMVAFLGLG
jgi:hypothetical protein